MDDRLRAYQRQLKAGNGDLEQYLRLVEQSGQDVPFASGKERAEAVRKYITNGGTLACHPMGAFFPAVRKPLIDAVIWLISQNLAHRALIVCPNFQMNAWYLFLKDLKLNFTPVLGVSQVNKLFGPANDASITLIQYDVLARVISDVLDQMGPASESWWPIIICDDVNLLRRTTSKRQKAIVHLAKRAGAKMRVGLTSMPVTRNLLDLYGIFQFIEPNLFGSAQQFVLEFMGEDPKTAIWKPAPLARVLDKIKNNVIDIRNVE